jgi:hypothetical protein
VTGDKLWFKEGVSKGPKRKMMPEKYRKVFANKQIVCVEYHDISEEDEREVFQVLPKRAHLNPFDLSLVESPTWHGFDAGRYLACMLW